MVSRPTVAVAGAGDLAKYFVEEALADDNFDIVVCTRSPKEWFNRSDVRVELTDYSTEQLTKILDDVSATHLVSFFVAYDDEVYLEVHKSFVEACTGSKTCKRFIPSEWVGDVKKFPDLPKFNIPSRNPIRRMLESQSEVEWTIVCLGMFMDYFVQESKSYLKDYGDMLPFRRDTWTAVIPGTGNEPVGFTACRDVMKAVVQLIEGPEWENYTYVIGENTTLNAIIPKMEKFWGKKLNSVVYKSKAETNASIAECLKEENPDYITLTNFHVEEWLQAGATHIPEDVAQLHKKKYFPGVHFRTIQEIMDDSLKMEKI